MSLFTLLFTLLSLLTLATALAAVAAQEEDRTADAAPDPVGVEVTLVELADRPLDPLPPGARRVGETFGCGDRLVAVDVELPAGTPTATPEEKVSAALGALFGWEGDGGDGLHHALRRSDLRVVEVAPVPMAAEEGLYRVRLSGRLRVSGTCDVPRIRRQIEATATRFPEVRAVEVYVGVEPLDKLLSARG